MILFYCHCTQGRKNKLYGYGFSELIAQTTNIKVQEFQPSDYSKQFYGDGKASEKIVKIILNYFS